MHPPTPHSSVRPIRPLRAVGALALAATLAGTMGACSGSSSSGSSSGSSSSSLSARDTTAAKSISGSIISSEKTTAGAAQVFAVKKKDADCIGEGLVSKVGTTKLVSYGVLDKSLKAKTSVTSSTNFSPTDAGSATDVFFSCTDVAGLVRKAVTKSGTIPTSIRACVNRALSDTTLRPFLEQTFEGKQAAAQKQITAQLTKCAGNSGG